MLTKDIKLKSLENGEYDREFYINDFKTVQKLDSIKNSIIIALMTRLGELNHNPTYNNFGCGAWSYLKQNNTELAKITIQEEIINTIMKIIMDKTMFLGFQTFMVELNTQAKRALLFLN